MELIQPTKIANTANVSVLAASWIPFTFRNDGVHVLAQSWNEVLAASWIPFTFHDNQAAWGRGGVKRKLNPRRVPLDSQKCVHVQRLWVQVVMPECVS